MGNGPLEARSRPHPRLSPRKPSCSLSATWGRPPPKCPRPAQPGALCPSWVQGFRGTPAPLSPPGPSPGSQVVWPAAQSPAARAPTAAPPRRTHSPSPPPWRLPLPAGEVGRFKPGALNSPAGPHHRAAARGGDHAPPATSGVPAPRRARPRPVPGLAARLEPARTRGGSRTAGGGAGRGSATRGSTPPRPGQWKAPAAEAPSGPGCGLCRSLLPLARSRFVAGGGDF
ncbi:unnamed protein product [Rangifer tarandus platyrhynchus]|uniref:Basic proline-rich protein-like n=1 Tax=Rangifer tarandus platyrhynchus TaxID=3082113 RepID=A0ABN8Z3U2_RANTA|nr:unnamed protein product [Rangifer tarandus platyrhynchus]